MMRMVNIGGVGLVQFQHRLVYKIYRKKDRAYYKNVDPLRVNLL